MSERQPHTSALAEKDDVVQCKQCRARYTEDKEVARGRVLGEEAAS